MNLNQKKHYFIHRIYIISKNFGLDKKYTRLELIFSYKIILLKFLCKNT
jgi:hypothetical protein